jgi:hypothetical protein
MVLSVAHRFRSTPRADGVKDSGAAARSAGSLDAVEHGVVLDRAMGSTHPMACLVELLSPKARSGTTYQLSGNRHNRSSFPTSRRYSIEAFLQRRVFLDRFPRGLYQDPSQPPRALLGNVAVSMLIWPR